MRCCTTIVERLKRVVTWLLQAEQLLLRASVRQGPHTVKGCWTSPVDCQLSVSLLSPKRASNSCEKPVTPANRPYATPTVAAPRRTDGTAHAACRATSPRRKTRKRVWRRQDGGAIGEIQPGFLPLPRRASDPGRHRRPAAPLPGRPPGSSADPQFLGGRAGAGRAGSAAALSTLDAPASARRYVREAGLASRGSHGDAAANGRRGRRHHGNAAGVATRGARDPKDAVTMATRMASPAVTGSAVAAALRRARWRREPDR